MEDKGPNIKTKGIYSAEQLPNMYRGMVLPDKEPILPKTFAIFTEEPLFLSDKCWHEGYDLDTNPLCGEMKKMEDEDVIKFKSKTERMLKAHVSRDTASEDLRKTIVLKQTYKKAEKEVRKRQKQKNYSSEEVPKRQKNADAINAFSDGLEDRQKKEEATRLVENAKPKTCLHNNEETKDTHDKEMAELAEYLQTMEDWLKSKGVREDTYASSHNLNENDMVFCNSITKDSYLVQNTKPETCLHNNEETKDRHDKEMAELAEYLETMEDWLKSKGVRGDTYASSHNLNENDMVFCNSITKDSYLVQNTKPETCLHNNEETKDTCGKEMDEEMDRIKPSTSLEYLDRRGRRERSRCRCRSPSGKRPKYHRSRSGERRSIKPTSRHDKDYRERERRQEPARTRVTTYNNRDRTYPTPESGSPVKRHRFEKEPESDNDDRRHQRLNRLVSTTIKLGSTPPEGAPDPPKDKPNFRLSDKLTKSMNKSNGVHTKPSKPVEAQKPKKIWRLYQFKGEEHLPMMPIHHRSTCLLGRDYKVVDIPIDHPSCCRQHAVLEFLIVLYQRENGRTGRRVLPYIIDLESTNGTYVNGSRIEAWRYLELTDKDILKFGFSSREYLILHEDASYDPVDYDSTPPI